MVSPNVPINKIDVRKEWWDNVFAPSSALAVITTVDAQGRVNAASFGTCTRVCHDPVYISFTCGIGKDTANNVLATGEFTVNLVPFEQAVLDKIVVCGLPFRPGINELEKARLGQVPARVVKPPRVTECRSHFECKVEWMHPWLHRLMVCGSVQAVSVDEDCIDANGHIVWDKAKPAHYCGHPYQGSFVPAYDKPTLAVACIASAALGPAPAAAQTDPFYRGKTITMIVGTGPSPGPVTGYPHALARVIGKYIPGNPTVIVSNMPGAGGIKAANYVYDIAPQDGTIWGFITRGFVLAPLLKPNVATFDPTKFNWIGSPTRSTSVGEVWTAATPVRSIQDAKTQEVIVGATSPTQDTGVFPAMLNRFVGTRFKIVSGYKSSGDVDLAIEKGEVQGKMGVTWSSLKGGPQSNWVKDGTVTIVVQFGLRPDPEVPADVPVALDLAKSPEDRQAIEVLGAPTEMGYPSFMGPVVPRDRVAMIRAAFVKALQGPEFAAMAETQGLEVNPIASMEIEKVVRRLYALPRAAVSRAAEVVP